MGFWCIDKLSRPVIIIIVIFLALCLIAGGIVAFFIPDILRDMVLKQLPIRDPTSTAFDSWQAPTNTRNPKDRQTVLMNYYLWNITNPVEFMAGAKPRIQQIGPYVHTQNRWKQAPGGATIPDNCYWTDDERLVHFKYHKVYFYDAERTGSKWNMFNDTVYTINVPLLALLPTILPIAAKLGFSQDTVVALLKDYPVVHKKTVQQALWGYSDALLELVAKLQPGRSSTFGLATNDTLEYYKQESVQYTGYKDIDKFINYKEWAGYKTLPWWASNDANFIQGTDGSMFPPVPIRKKNKVWVFIDELGRSMEIEYQKEVTYKGITLYRYNLGADALKSYTEVPKNIEFYSMGPSGLFNLTSMRGAPIFVGKPQFLDGAQSYRDALITNVDGYDSSRDALDTTISVEPYTGATFMFDKRLQVNYKVERFSWLPATSNLTDVMLPVYWAEEQMQLSQKKVDDWNHKIGNLLKAARIFSFIGVIIGSLQFCFGIALLVNYCMIREQHSKEYFVESPAIVDPQDNHHFPNNDPNTPTSTFILN